MALIQKATRKFFEGIDFVERVVPTPSWFRYAALRLGAFIMTYLGTISLTVLILALSGIMLSFGAVIALVPLAIFIAIRVSGALTEKWRSK